jgi:hypothetical protein
VFFVCVGDEGFGHPHGLFFIFSKLKIISFARPRRLRQVLATARLVYRFALFESNLPCKTKMLQYIRIGTLMFCVGDEGFKWNSIRKEILKWNRFLMENNVIIESEIRFQRA